jgi:hypothetical protein
MFQIKGSPHVRDRPPLTPESIVTAITKDGADISLPFHAVVHSKQIL